MDTETIRGLLARQKPARVLFPYYKDYYAIYLLKHYIGTGMTVRALKQSPFAGFLHKPIVRDVIATCSDGQVTPDRLDMAWGLLDWNVIETYRLSLGRWGKGRGGWEQSYYQTSRPGENLVVQLNFGNKHNSAYQRWIRPQGYHPFVSPSHPTRADDELTLAWCRVDADVETGEALIEEVQNDWLRRAHWRWVWAQNRLAWLRQHWEGRVFYPKNERYPRCRIEGLERYVTQVLEPHRTLWAEAVLAATLQFLVEDLGIRTVFYHTYEGGNRLKGLRTSTPPRSLYTKVPKRFGFRKTDRLPAFLQQVRRVRKAAATKPIPLFCLNL